MSSLVARSAAARLAAALFVSLLFSTTLASPAAAQSFSAAQAPAYAPTGSIPQDFRSQHFILHTDLTAAEAKELLEKLEYMLGIISVYWQKPPQGIIECYVAKDVGKWPAGSIPDDYGRQKIARREGVTVSLVLGNEGKSTVYASAEGGVTQHEAVHAYCAQNFGTTGPTWYSEGMAEMGQYWRKGSLDVQVHEYVVKHIRESEPKSLNAIVNSKETTGDSWENYAWRWALCHLLASNPNYAANFRPLGLGILNQKPVSFEQAYGHMANEISFEYLFFLQRLCNGFRNDLCAWDWKRKFTAMAPGTARTMPVQAARGFQPTGILVKAGQSYDVNCTGTWKLDKKSTKPVTAAGEEGAKPEDDGKLIGTIFSEFQLSEEFEIGATGSFTIPSDGQLYVRCRSDWGSIGDNTGTITVKLTAAK